MKNTYLLLAFIFTFASCNCQKKAVEANASEKTAQESLPKLEYVANTRGFYQKVTIENQMVTVSSDRNDPNKGKAVKLSDSEIKELQAAFQKVSVNDLATYKDPTQKRFYDGAAIANLKITQN